jgi:PAS domain S-box-containing protein
MVALDSSGNVFFSIPDNDSLVSPYLSHGRLSLIRNSGRIHVGDFFIREDGIPIMQITIPVIKAAEKDTLTIGWILLNINLKKDFLSLLESVPIPSQSMQTVIIYKEKNNIVHLSSRAFEDMKKPVIRKFKGKKNMSSVRVISGFRGIEQGLDYNGVPVLSMSLPIPESQTILQIKKNKSEAYADVYKARINIAALATLMVLTFTSSVSFFWLKQRHELTILEQEKKMILERFDMLSKFANDAIILYSRDLTILQVNDKALELYEYSREELLGMSADLLRIPEKRDELPSLLETTIKEGGFRFETIHIRKDGTPFHVEVSLRYMEMFGSPCFQALIRDITQRKQFERALISSEERLRLITNTMPQIVWTAKPDGNFDFVNSRLESLTGLYPMKENSIGFIHPDDQIRVTDYWRQAITDIREHQIRFRIRMKDGIFRWFLCIAIPLCNEDGEVIRWYGSATDIDELENQVSQRTAELSDLYNNAPCGYYSLDASGDFVKINDTALNWLGYTREEIIGNHRFQDMITQKSSISLPRILNIFITKGYVNNLEFDMIRKDGSIFPVLLSATAVYDKENKVSVIRTTIIDHTERRRHEDEIMKLNTILQEHGYNLEYSNKELEAFIFSVSHDLRAPLRAINGFSKILMDDYNDKLDMEGRKMLHTVWDNANRMKQLIDDLLRLSRAGRQELTYSKIDMQALFTSMIEETRQQFPEKNIVIKMNALPVAYGDLALLKQVITNLLSNAVKFSGKRTISEIEVGFERNNNEITFFVKDNGTGFDMQYSHELFGVFRRLANAEDFEGTGVGLALVKRIIDKHGGRVWAFSEPDKGATFYFTLPENKVA